MIKDIPTYKKAITTDRPAEMLAKKHGFKSLTELADSLPKNARVLDLGAGASPFGKEVATLRPDIEWVNFDYSYKNPAIFSEVTKDKLANVKYVSGDTTKLRQYFDQESFDVVFSYWLFPHLSLKDIEPAKQAANAVFLITKTGGLISIGPKMSKSRLPALNFGKPYRTIKSDDMSVTSFVDRVIDTTRARGFTRYIQVTANEVATPFFGTTRYAKRRGHIPFVYDPKSGKYISPFSPRALVLASKLGASGITYIIKRSKRSH